VTYYFKPAGHWNIITKEVYDVLVRFYGPDMLKAQ
jgi:hypothetical protein